MRNVSSEFISEADSFDNFPVIKLYVYWDGTRSFEETVNLVQLNATISGTSNLASLQPKQQTMFTTVSLFNKDYRYTPDRVSGQLTGVDTELWDYIRDMPEEGFTAVFYCGFKLDSGAEELIPMYVGRLIDYSHNEISDTVMWTLVDLSWYHLQKKDATSVFSRLDYKEIGDVYGFPIDPRSHKTYHVWVDDDSYLNDVFKLTNLSLGYRYDNPETGKMEFPSCDTWFIQNRDRNPNFSPVYSFDPSFSYSDMNTSTSNQNRATEIIVNYAARYIGTNQVLFELEEPLIVGPAKSDTEFTTKQFILKADKVIFSNIFPVINETYGITSGFGINMQDFVDVGFGFNAQQIMVTITNRHLYQGAMMRYFVLYGNPVFGGVSGNEKRTHSGEFRRSRTISDDFYMQTRSHATWLANILYDRVKYRVPTRKILNAPPLFYLEVGDLVHYKPLHGQDYTKGIIAEVTINFTGDSITQDYVIVDFDYLYPAPNKNYFVIGDELDNTEVVFY